MLALMGEKMRVFGTVDDFPKPLPVRRPNRFQEWKKKIISFFKKIFGK
ncbi:MAG TPA: hypothetical protein VJH70_01375 [Candidatus Paceibacterota bacterium]